jgi:hypothetical protein
MKCLSFHIMALPSAERARYLQSRNEVPLIIMLKMHSLNHPINDLFVNSHEEKEAIYINFNECVKLNVTQQWYRPKTSGE